MLGVVGSSLKMVKFEPTTPKTSPRTCCNRVAKRTRHVAPNNVAMGCVGMLRSFGRGFTSEDVCRSVRNVKLMNFVFQNAFYCHICHRSLCVISYYGTLNTQITVSFISSSLVIGDPACYNVCITLQWFASDVGNNCYLYFCARLGN